MIKGKESSRIDDSLDSKVPPWRKWGTFVSERQWGTVREDYSIDGTAWQYLPHDMARSRAYRWGEDGIAGWCDQYQTIVFSLALWNGKDPILKERLFGLTPFEGNHGEDVKECFFYLDSTPTHSYTKFLYKYPQNEFPYDQLVQENQKRTTSEREFELIDTGIFAQNRYFDVVVEYAKASPEDLCIRIEIFNRGDQAAELHVLPQILFRNRWSWNLGHSSLPEMTEGPHSSDFMSIYADPKDMIKPDWTTFDYDVPPLYLYGDRASELLFTNNETHQERVFGPQAKSASPYVKDAFHRYVIDKQPCVNPGKMGTKACFHYADIEILPNESHVIRMRLTPETLRKPLSQIDDVVAQRKKEADDFFKEIQPETLSEDDRRIHRQAVAGTLWSAQYYFYDVRRWLEGDNNDSPPDSRYHMRNAHWKHVHSNHIITMPDKWEYPWFASWDSAFHAVVLSLVDIPFAKKQLKTFLLHQFQHPNGQIPAYEWSFSDTNPPVQAWALWKIYHAEKNKTGKADLEYLEYCFLKLMENFSWWVNKIDRLGNNVFEGGFLGLDNISIVDRSDTLLGGDFFQQSDATGWMAFFSLLMMKLALEIAKEKPLFELIAFVYFEHFVNIALAIQGTKERPMDLWDEQDGFFYDAILHPNGDHERLKVRSFVGLVPFFSFEFFEDKELQAYPRFYKHFQLFLLHQKALTGRSIIELTVEGKKRYLFSLMTLDQIRKMFHYAWDSNEFLSPYGLRSLSKYHEKNPLFFAGKEVMYEPGESLEKIKGGNSNWRGPIWFPTNFLFLKSLEKLANAVGPSFIVETPEGALSIDQMVQSLRARMINLFRLNPQGLRPIHGEEKIFQSDPYWKDLILFYEHFHGDMGRGLGATHQTGWSALVANLITEL